MVLRGSTRTRFSVLADYESSTLSRVLEQFTVRSRCCEALSAKRTHEGMQWIEMDFTDLDDHEALVLLQKVRAIVSVKTARIETLVLKLDKLAA